MPRLAKDQWETIRAEREAGASFGSLAIKYGVSKGAITNRAGREQWADGKDVAAIIRRRVSEKVSGIVSADPVKKAAAIEAVTDKAVEVLKRHQDEPAAVRTMLESAIKAHKEAESKEAKALAFDDLKAAKISSEVLLNLHRLERQAWNLDAAATVTVQNTITNGAYFASTESFKRAGQDLIDAVG